MPVQKLDFVDRMRGLAILAVIAVHYAQMFASPALKIIGATGQVGVQLFFVASAFTLCLSADQRAGEAHGVRNFYIRRYFRIAPLYYLGIAAYSALYIGVGKGANYTADNILANVFFVHGVIPSANNSIVPGGWTIGAEMLFYFIFPALYWAVERSWRRFGARVLAGWMAFALLVALGWHFGYRLETGRWIANNQFPYTVFIAQFPVFMIGIVYYLAAWRGDALAPHRLRDGLLAIAGFSLCSWVIVADVRPLYGVLPTFAGIASVFLANWLRGQNAQGGWLVAIGKVSFSLYVLHFLLVWQPSAWVIWWFEGDPLSEWLIALPLFAINVLVLFWAGRITLRFIETPANNLARALIRRLDKPKEIPVS
ncbi:acyltransferase [Novosphingobium sp.]|uniref:acyltransferase family protein n=1 Tax=Novosphingobium sp. TaxID=1874826 RepID=UPI0027324BCB|nr:acyltransferase [Novosphingobium sp.]MDP3906844.1 acyltransferase [Novosphingobium sp.]